MNKSDLNGSTLVISTGQRSIDNTENSENGYEFLTILYVVSRLPNAKILNLTENRGLGIEIGL